MTDRSHDSLAGDSARPPVSDPPSVCDAALSYAVRGWPVLPLWWLRPFDGSLSCACRRGEACESPAKHPLTSRGVHDATTATATIREWWSRWPTANVGIATGAASRLVVLDVDSRHGGHQSLAALEASHRSLPETLAADTGNGRHLYFASPDGIPFGDKLAKGIDLRADARLVVAPPSLHASGRRYAWTTHREPAQCPDWVVELGRRRATPRRSVSTKQPLQWPSVGPAIDTLPATARDALYRGTSQRHRAVWTALLSMLRAGFGDLEAGAAVLASPLADKVRERGNEWLWDQIRRAAALIAETPGGLTKSDFLAEVDRHEAAADAAVDVWASRQGRPLRKVLRGFQLVARQRGGGEFDAGVRDVAEAAGVSKSTVTRRWPQLVELGWLQAVAVSRPQQGVAGGSGAASCWKLTVPPGRSFVGHNQDVEYQGTGCVPPATAIPATHPAFRREALGASGDTLRLLLAHGPKAVGDLAVLNGLGARQQRRHIQELAEHGLVTKNDQGRVHVAPGCETRLEQVAAATGAIAAQQRARRRHAHERELHARYLSSTRRPCQTCGQVLYGDASCPDCTQQSVV